MHEDELRALIRDAIAQHLGPVSGEGRVGTTGPTSFGGADGGVGTLDGRAGTLDGRVGTFDGRVGTLDGRVGTLDGRVGTLDGRAGTLDGRAGSFDGRAGTLDGRAGCPNPALSWKTHLSHGRFVFLAPTEPDAPCVVEPQVRCHHCGFCQSYGH